MIVSQIDDRCAICAGLHEENIHHVLFRCEHARACWLLSPLGIRTPELQEDISSLIWNWITNWDRQRIEVMANLMWCIWKHRWRAIKEGMNLDARRIVNEAMRLSHRDDESDTDLSNTSYNGIQPELLDQQISLEGMVKINVDGGVRDGVGAAVCMIRDHAGSFVSGSAILEQTGCVAYTKALAIRLGLQEARRLGYTKVMILSDALGIVQAIMDGNCNFPWQARSIVTDITHLLKDFEVGYVRFIRRNFNEIADTLVHETLNCNTARSWDSCPDSIQRFVTQA